MSEFYRYINESEFKEKDVILLKACDTKNVDNIIPKWFEVVYSNVRKHANTDFIGKEVHVFSRFVRPATDAEISQMNRKKKAVAK